MRITAILNREGGTFRTLDLDAFAQHLRDTLRRNGHRPSVHVVGASEITASLAAARDDADTDVVMAGGGDGTISAAAAALRGREKALAVLPAGTMNLFARSLGVPLDLDEALEAIATGGIRRVDVATANGKPFIHQFSIGLHPELVRERERMRFSSRAGKIGASFAAAATVLVDPPWLEASVALDGGPPETITATGISVSNNLFGKGHIPYTDNPDGGTLGVYVGKARGRLELMGFMADMAIGRNAESPHVDVRQARRVMIEINSRSTRLSCTSDGELGRLEESTTIAIEPKVLRVLGPAPP